MSYEKPQKGNPHGLTVNQHTFPYASIARYANTDGCVSFSSVRIAKCLKLRPDDRLFCAKRTWDQRAEEGYMKEIEDNFQSLAEAILDGRVAKIGFFEKPVVNYFFALWNIRTHRKHQPIQDVKLRGERPERCLTKNEQELLEKHHIGFVRPDMTVPGRQMAGINIQMNLDIAHEQLNDARWGILRSIDGEFIVPDNFSSVRIVPISPTVCLYSHSTNDVISREKVAEINRHAVVSSVEYVFATDFSACPL